MINIDNALKSHDLTEKQCRTEFECGNIAIIQADETQQRIFFLKSSGDKGYIVTNNGSVKRYKTPLDCNLKITWLKGL